MSGRQTPELLVYHREVNLYELDVGICGCVRCRGDVSADVVSQIVEVEKDTIALILKS